MNLEQLAAIFRRFFIISLVIVFGLTQPAIAAQWSSRGSVYHIPLTQQGTPNWQQISYSNIGTVQSGNTGILDDISLINTLGYNPSRSYSAGTPLSKIIKVGDLKIAGVDQRPVRSFLGRTNPARVSLRAFPAINGMSLKQLVTAIPSLANMPVSSVPLVRSIVYGQNAQSQSKTFELIASTEPIVVAANKASYASTAISLATSLSPDIQNFISQNPWAANLPIEQLIQGNWNGVVSQGLQIGLQQLTQQLPALANIPIGSLASSLLSGNLQAALNTAISAGATYLIGQLVQQFPALANMPIGLLTNISNFSLASVPGLVNTALSAFPGLANQLVSAVPGLANVPLSTILALLQDATATVDLPDQGAGDAKFPLTGGGYTWQPKTCDGNLGDCENFEIHNVKGLTVDAKLLNGRQWVTKKQQVKGGRGPLAKMFNGKEPVHIRPWGDDPNVSLAALKVNDAKGAVEFGLYLRVCVKPPFAPKTCTPYAIGPIPYGTVDEGGTIVIASSDPPPVVSPTLSGGQGCAGGAGGLPAPSSNPNAPLSQQNLKRYLDRIAAGESAGGTNLGPNYLGAYGKYQFIPSTRDAILRKYGYDAWNPAQWDQAAISLIKDVGGQGLLNAISAGDFQTADRTLNRTWTSLPGGAEQSPLWNNPANLVAYGPVSGSQVANAGQASSQNTPQGAQQGQGTLLASAAGSVCGTPIPCPPGQKCILLNPNPKGIIPSYGGMYGAPRPGRIHAGVDLQSPKAAQNWQRGPGENIRAAADGNVTEHVPVGGACGGVVAISHPGFNLETRYVHMVQTFVTKGQTVSRGQDIGVEGNETPEGCGSTGAHLHYEIYFSGGTTDPTRVQHEPSLPTSPGA